MVAWISLKYSSSLTQTVHRRYSSISQLRFPWHSPASMVRHSLCVALAACSSALSWNTSWLS